MANADNISDSILAQMIAERDNLARALAKMEKSIEERESALRDLRGASSAAVLDTPKPRSTEFDGMALPSASHHALTLQKRRDCLTARKIFEILKSHDAEPQTSSPIQRIQIALQRRAETDKDIIHTGDGEWGLCEWYSEKELRQFEALLENERAVDKKHHADRMRKGIKRTQDRGAHYGAAPKVTPEQWQRAVDMLNSGETLMTKIHAELVKMMPEGDKPMHIETLRRQIRLIKAGKGYPPRWKAYFDNHRSKQEPDTPSLRLVE